MKTRNYHGVSLARRLSISAAAFAVAFFGAASGSSLAFADPGTPPGSTDEDPAANQVFTIPADATTPEALNKLLQGLNDTVENNSAIQKMNELGKTINVEQGKVAELTSNFGGWTPVDSGKFAIAQKTDKDIFPVETVNVTNNPHKYTAYPQESSFDRSSNYILLLAKTRTAKNSTDQAVDSSAYASTGKSGDYSAGTVGFNGIEKTFKAYSPDTGSHAVISFKTGYTGDLNGTKAQYKVEVFKGRDATDTNKLYETTFKPDQKSETEKHTVVPATDGTNKIVKIPEGNTEQQANEALTQEAPNGKSGTFTSKEISIPKGTTEYTVRISSADNMHLGMSYQAPFLQYALPLTGVDFSITQDTKAAAKMVLQKMYDSLAGTQEADTKKMTSESVTPYKEKLDAAKNLLAQADLAATSAYKSAAQEAMTAKDALVPAEKIAIEKITIAAQEKMDAIVANSTLSPAEQEQFKKLVEDKKTEALTAVKKAADTAAIIAAQDKELAEIAKINPVGHEAAKKAINDALTAKTTEITNNTSLTDAEKNTAIQQAQTIATTQLDAITNQPTTTTTPDEAATAQQAITTATQTGVNGINQINPVGHEAAKKAINDALTAKTTEITNNTSLTDAEKNTAIQQAQTIATTQLDAITNQPTTTTTPDEAATAQQAINEARDAAVREIGKIQPKPAAKPASPSGKAHSASTPTPKGMPNTGSTGLGLAGLCGLLMAGAGIALRRRSAAKMSA